jgi:alpha-galactosidase
MRKHLENPIVRIAASAVLLLTATLLDKVFCVTVAAIPEYHEYWSKYCNSYRGTVDTYGHWANLLEIYECYFKRMDRMCKGHYFDLDMLDIGTGTMESLQHALTEDEMLMEYTMRAILNSPIQISSTLENVSGFELDVYCNEEVIALNQDCAFNTARPTLRYKDGELAYDVIEKELEDGSYAYAIFNIGEKEAHISLIVGGASLRDLWAKENICHEEKYSFDMMPHTTRLFKSSEKLVF